MIAPLIKLLLGIEDITMRGKIVRPNMFDIK